MFPIVLLRIFFNSEFEFFLVAKKSFHLQMQKTTQGRIHAHLQRAAD